MTLPQFLTEAQIADALTLFQDHGGIDAKGKIQKQVIEPNMDAINKKLGQDNDPSYLAYAVVYVFSQVDEQHWS
jgi:hypothetical protein